MNTIHQINNSLGSSVFNTVSYKNTSYVPHMHKSFEVMYVVCGEAKVTVQGREYVASAGQFVMVLPYNIHSFEVMSGGELFVAVFSEACAKDFCSLLNGKMASGAVFDVSLQTRIYFERSIVESYGERFDAPSSSELIMLSAAISAVGFDYLNSGILKDSSGDEGEALCQKLINYTVEHFDSDLTLDAIAKHFGYSYQYISKVFNEQIGGFKVFLNSYRIENAKRLLAMSDKSVTDIALDSGFGSVRNFNHIFIRQIGQKPLEYRKNSRK